MLKIKDIEYFSHKDYINKNILYIRWVVTYNCNLKCYYCPLYHSENYLDKTEYIKIINFINNQINEYDEVRLTLFGGECTQHPNFIDILNTLDDRLYIRLDTNLNYSINYLKEIININKIKEYQTSYHYKIVNEEIYYNNYLYLLNNTNNNYTVNNILMMEKKYINDIFELEKTTYKNSTIKRVKNDNNKWDNECDIMNKISDINNKNKYYNNDYYIKDINGNDIYINEANIDLYNLRCFKFFLCDTIKHLLFITSNGDVYTCQKQSELVPKPLPIFNIINNDKIIEKIQNKKHICNCSYCCEIDIPKHRIVSL